MVVPQTEWFIREIPTQMNNLGVPLFLETAIWMCPKIFPSQSHFQRDTVLKHRSLGSGNGPQRMLRPTGRCRNSTTLKLRAWDSDGFQWSNLLWDISNNIHPRSRKQFRINHKFWRSPIGIQASVGQSCIMANILMMRSGSCLKASWGRNWTFRRAWNVAKWQQNGHGGKNRKWISHSSESMNKSD